MKTSKAVFVAGAGWGSFFVLAWFMLMGVLPMGWTSFGFLILFLLIGVLASFYRAPGELKQ